jgi:hypothetical protein
MYSEFFSWNSSDIKWDFFLSNERGLKFGNFPKEFFLWNKIQITKEGFQPELFACRVIDFTGYMDGKKLTEIKNVILKIRLSWLFRMGKQWSLQPS